MNDRYFTVNIREYLQDRRNSRAATERLNSTLEGFSCPQNVEVEHFLKANAVEFTKRSQSVTYLVFDTNATRLVGYFALAMKPVSVRLANISKTTAKKLSRVSILDCFFVKKIERAQLLVRF